MRLIITTLAFALVATAASAETFKTVSSDKGDVLAGENGMTLYTFRKDEKGMSNCYDACAQNWPPYIAAADANAQSPYSLVERKDGAKQWAKDGLPLYFWVKDTKMGDATGDGFKEIWDAARP